MSAPRSIDEIPTPALLLDLDAFKANQARMAARIAESGKALRPHAKAHKCVEIARRQIAAGAVGVCVATLAEAELMVEGAIGGLLLTSPVADPLKIARIAALGEPGQLMAVADHLQQVEWFEQAAAAAGRTMGLLVDLDVGDHRTGASRDQALALAEAIDMAPHLELRGLQAYSVLGSHAGGLEERRRVSRRVFRGVDEVVANLTRRGLDAGIVSGGSTGTWEIDTKTANLTELQAGSYVFMDMAYAREGLDFQHALTVLATVVSANHEAFVTVDAGTKAFATDRGYGPEVRGLPGAGFRWGGDEFGYVDLEGVERKPRLGERVRFLPPHCDPTVNLYDRIYACRGNRVDEVWPVKRPRL